MNAEDRRFFVCRFSGGSVRRDLIADGLAMIGVGLVALAGGLVALPLGLLVIGLACLFVAVTLADRR